ncbi:MAG TPA: multicopper oxidase domain-containing protein [Albidovulum sp.]|uniref:multicopper oxidase domain-containing protein n=1 Tax=Albidovulum sp. TaxID=1872424 RepID=UPI002CB5EC68|nr:multicopper oxidase domain-containing protein [Albidovulum sp.]
MRNTVYVPPMAMAMVTVALDAGEAARWMLHCHHMPHLATGMMTELAVAPAAKIRRPGAARAPLAEPHDRPKGLTSHAGTLQACQGRAALAVPGTRRRNSDGA